MTPYDKIVAYGHGLNQGLWPNVAILWAREHRAHVYAMTLMAMEASGMRL